MSPNLFILADAGNGLDISSEGNLKQTEEAPMFQPTKIKWHEKIKAGSIFKVLLYGISQKPAGSSLDPDNDLLQIPRYTLENEFRPDFSVDYDILRLSVKPRLNISLDSWGEGSRDEETETDTDWFVNEWLASLSFFREIYLSYGRENLQWGPSYFISPSNPFFRDNGLSNPKREVPGLDFARLVWVPNSSWTLSLIANLDEGRQEFFDEFKQTYAVKLDYTAYQKYVSLIVSYQESGKDAQGNRDNDIERVRLGGFAGWTVSDALLLYGEATGTLKNNVLYPADDPASPFGSRMLPVKEDKDSLEGLVLMGGSYTLENGQTLTLEYVHNSAGYSNDEAEDYFDLRARASENLFSPEPAYSLSRLILKQSLDPGLRLLRKNYFMLQYQHIRIRDVIDLIARCVYNVDDNSGQLVPIVQYDIGDNFQLFLVGMHNFGNIQTEFRSIIDYSYMAGIEFTF